MYCISYLLLWQKRSISRPSHAPYLPRGVTCHGPTLGSVAVKRNQDVAGKLIHTNVYPKWYALHSEGYFWKEHVHNEYTLVYVGSINIHIHLHTFYNHLHSDTVAACFPTVLPPSWDSFKRFIREKTWRVSRRKHDQKVLCANAAELNSFQLTTEVLDLLAIQNM